MSLGTSPLVIPDHLLAAREILGQIAAEGYSAFIVGGAVRDWVLQRPVKDIDIATDMPLSLLANRFKTHDIGRNKDFGIVVIPWKGHTFEVARFRGLTEYDDHGKPRSIEAGDTFAEDAAHRDFTMNAMAMDAQGEIIDPEGGLSDIAARTIRCAGIPVERMREDPLRAIRAVRFAAALHFSIEPQTRQAVTGAKKQLQFVSGERLAGELLKMAALPGSVFATAIKTLSELDLLASILPEVDSLRNLPHDPNHHPEGDVFAHTLAAVAANTGRDPEVNLAVLLHDIGKATTLEIQALRPTYYGHDKAAAPMLEALGARLRLPPRLVRSLVFAATNHMKGLVLAQMRPSKIIKLVMNEDWPVLREVVRCDCQARGRKKEVQDIEKQFLQAEELASNWENLKKQNESIINGQKVMAISGFPPSPRIGEIIRHITGWVMDNGFQNKKAIETEVKRFISLKWGE